MTGPYDQDAATAAELDAYRESWFAACSRLGIPDQFATRLWPTIAEHHGRPEADDE